MVFKILIKDFWWGLGETPPPAAAYSDLGGALITTKCFLALVGNMPLFCIPLSIRGSALGLIPLPRDRP